MGKGKSLFFYLCPLLPPGLQQYSLGRAGGLLYYTILLFGEPWFSPLVVVRILAFVLAGWGVFIICLCFRQYNWRQFAGLENKEGVDAPETGRLLQYTRHPMYAGTLLVLPGFWLYAP